MKKIVVKLFFVLVISFVFILSVNAQAISVTGSSEKRLVKRGAKNKGTIVLSIPNELHINSNKPTSEFMIPTTIKFSSNQAKITKIVYPKGKNKKFDFSEEPINVYEGKTIIKFNFTVPAKLKSKLVRIRALVSYQSCTNEVCYQPEKKEIFITAKVL
jgi:Disulphide bond corrector protein DsbC